MECKKKLKLEQFPKKGDICCVKDNLDAGFPWFSTFTEEDENVAKANKKFYYIIYA
jgi:hypothetical protein